MQYNIKQSIKRFHDDHANTKTTRIFGRIVVRRFPYPSKFEAFLIDDMTIPDFYKADKNTMIEVDYPELLTKMQEARVPRQAGGAIAYNYDAHVEGTLSRSSIDSSIVLINDLIELIVYDDDSQIKVIP